jgi:hypothetical protein
LGEGQSPDKHATELQAEIKKTDIANKAAMIIIDLFDFNVLFTISSRISLDKSDAVKKSQSKPSRKQSLWSATNNAASACFDIWFVILWRHLMHFFHVPADKPTLAAKDVAKNIDLIHYIFNRALLSSI